MHIEINFGTKFQLKLTNLTFWTKFFLKRYFRPKTEKMSSTTEFCIFELGTKLQLKLTIFECFLPKKGTYGRKWENRTCACVHGCYLLYQTFPHGSDKRNSILMSLLVLVAETISTQIYILSVTAIAKHQKPAERDRTIILYI